MLTLKINDLTIPLHHTTFDKVCDIDVCLNDCIYDIIKILLNNVYIKFTIMNEDNVIASSDIKLDNYDLLRVNGHITREYITDHVINLLKGIDDTYYTRLEFYSNGDLKGPFYFNGKIIDGSTEPVWLIDFYNNVHGNYNERMYKNIRSNSELVIPMWCKDAS